MIEFLIGLIDFVFTLIFEETINETVSPKAKRNCRFIIFSLICLIVEVIITLSAVYFWDKQFGISIFILFVDVLIFIFWCSIIYKKHKKE